MIRPLQEKDYPEVERMISDFSNISFLKNAITYVTDKLEGFVTFYFYKGNPVLQHFYIKPGCRNIRLARQLIKDYIELIKQKGCFCTFISAKEDYLCRIIEYYFKIKSTRVLNGLKYYITEV